MIRSCFRLLDGPLRTDLSREEIAAVHKGGTGLLWVDITADRREDGEPLLRDVFGFHHLTIDDCYNTLIDPPKVDNYGEYLFLIIHTVAHEAATQQLTTAELDLYVGAHYVVSVHRSPVSAVEDVLRRAEQRSLVLDRGAPFLAHALFDVVVDEFHPVVEALEDQVTALQEQVLEHPERNVLEDVLALRRNAQRLKRTILPQRDVANRFARGDYGQLVHGEALIYFRDIYDHTARVEETIDAVRDISDGALNTYLSSVNNRTNEVMKTLAIVTVVFLPLTLLASVYGTNFDDTFPQYDTAWGFAAMWSAFAVIAGGLLAWFRWRRWI